MMLPNTAVSSSNDDALSLVGTRMMLVVLVLLSGLGLVGVEFADIALAVVVVDSSTDPDDSTVTISTVVLDVASEIGSVSRGSLSVGTKARLCVVPM